MNPNVFVYGTLRSDANGAMSSFLKRHAKYVDKGKIEGKLYAVSWYPAAVEASERYVIGEVWRLFNPENAFPMLDEYEGAPSLYVRKEVLVRLFDDTTLSAWVYFYNQPVDRYREIASGDFLNQ